MEAPFVRVLATPGVTALMFITPRPQMPAPVVPPLGTALRLLRAGPACCDAVTARRVGYAGSSTARGCRRLSAAARVRARPRRRCRRRDAARRRRHLFDVPAPS